MSQICSNKRVTANYFKVIGVDFFYYVSKKINVFEFM